MPVDSGVVHHMNRILWPTAIVLSTEAFVRTLVKENVASVAKYFGYSNGDSPSTGTTPGDQSLPTSHSPDIQKALQKLRQKTTQRPDEVNDPSTIAKTAAAEANQPSSGKQQQQDPKGQQPGESPLKSASGREGNKGQPGAPSSAKEYFIGHNEIKSMISQKPWDEFKKRFAQTWKPIVHWPPRGCVAVSGLVELEGQRGLIVIDVMAFYDPKTKKYDRKSMIMKVRRMQAKQQHPRR
jgi:hypothetical protein